MIPPFRKPITNLYAAILSCVVLSSTFSIHLYTNLLTSDYFCKTSTTDEKISHISWEPKVHYRVHNSPLVNPIFILSNPVHKLVLFLQYTHFNIISLLRLQIRTDLLLLVSPPQSSVVLSSTCTCHMLRPSPLPSFYDPKSVWRLVRFEIFNLLIGFLETGVEFATGHFFSLP